MNMAMKNSTMAPVQKNAADDSNRKGGGFIVIPLSHGQRKALGIDCYYRPFKIERVCRDDSRWNLLAKRGLDVVLSVMALMVLWPILLLFMIAVVIEDPHSSPIFCQRRIGKDGKAFMMYKLRSMYTNAEDMLPSIIGQNEVSGNAFKIKNDPRISRVGRIARKYCIDEVLQLINVLKSDMSLVGPRPPLPQEVERYDAYERQRLTIKPGMTCYWQVYPQRHEVSFDDWVAMDIKYIVSHSVKTDVELLLNTVCVIFSGHGD